MNEQKEPTLATSIEEIDQLKIENLSLKAERARKVLDEFEYELGRIMRKYEIDHAAGDVLIFETGKIVRGKR